MKMISSMLEGVLVGVTVLWSLPFFAVGYLCCAAYVGFQVGGRAVSAWANR